MPPDGYTTVTISEATAAKLSQIMAHHELESLAMAIDHAATLALDEEMMTNAEIAQLLSHRLQSTNDQ